MILSAKELNEIVQAVLETLQKRVLTETQEMKVKEIIGNKLNEHCQDFEHKERMLTPEEVEKLG